METGYMFSYAGKNALSLYIWDQLVIVEYILHSFMTRRWFLCFLLSTYLSCAAFRKAFS